ncbi:MAG: hypothetical protein K6T75_01700 [Acetobacteraceae bacterium]|nr:hypothetical protein [Acetobacteraceae bacterium]
MTQGRRVTVEMPEALLQEVDGLAILLRCNRSSLILEATRAYLRQRKRRDVRERLREGYRAMAAVNLALAEGLPDGEGRRSRPSGAAGGEGTRGPAGSARKAR